MKCVTSKKYITCTLYHSVKVIIPKITNNNNNRIPHYDAIKMHDTGQTFAY